MRGKGVAFLRHSEPNKGLELTGNSVRSSLAPALPSSSCLAFGAKRKVK